jgi:hypothetical protein
MASNSTHNYRTSRRTFSGKCKVSNKARRSARNERKPRIGQLRVTARNMPHAVFRHAWMGNGTQAAIARSNDRYICGHFAADQTALCSAVVFEGGGAEDKALLWLRRQQSVNG